MDLFEGMEHVGVTRLRDALAQQPAERQAITDALKTIAVGKTRDGQRAALLIQQPGILRDDELRSIAQAVADGDADS